jgi:hypothetical protein
MANLRAGILTDHLAFDGVESVTHRSKRTSGDLDTTVAHALRRELTNAESAPSRGVSVAGRIAWTLPVNDLGAVAVKPKDQIIDGAGDVWTVLTADLVTLRSRYRCEAINLKIAFDLRESVTIERASYTIGRSGNRVLAYSPLATVYARFQPDEASPGEGRGMRGQVNTYRVPFDDPDLAIQADDRLNRAGVYYRITRHEQAQRIDELPVLSVELAL